MKNKKLFFFGFALLILLIPAYLVFKSESILTDGTLYKFRPQAYDPFDPFRGKFLRMNYDTGDIPCNEDVDEDQTVYVSVGVDEEGYAFFEEVFTKPPKDKDYVKSVVRYTHGNEVDIEIPDNMRKYFINEDKALDAEHVFFEERDSIYIGVRILDGEARLEDIYVHNQPILEYLEKH